ncbi:hypothetical protein MNBD_GAMMA22-1545 [hydrothermal vent metagenome]|uniref:Polysaccharide chain length determinant N-terminal domain-containing protein n=1 Tax=hydrothermal vent metagenome TaxID=652676 RepID=A0A3B0ZWQ9_9ZZZZ
MNQTEKSVTPIPLQYYLPDSEQNDEIDLFELVISIVSQWKLILLIAIIGTLISIAYAKSIPKQFENYTQLRKPIITDIKIIKLNGYDVNLESLFLRLHNNLKSPEIFKNYLILSGVISKLYPNLKSETEIKQAVIGMTSNLSVNFVDGDYEKTKSDSPSDVFQVRLSSTNENSAISIINKYVKDTEQDILKKIKERGQYSINLRKQEIEETIFGLRNLAKQQRFNAIADLKETLKLALTMDVKKPLLTVPANNSDSTNLTLFLSESKQQQKYMVGSDYLNAEIDRLESRGLNSDSDDAFIPKLPNLLSELSVLNERSFNFDGAKLFIVDKLAEIGDAPAKPNKKLIVLIGMLLSIFFALFLALIVATIKKRKLLEEKN